MADPLLSVITPVLDECDNVVTLRDRLDAALGETGAAIEFVFVDDGSTDGTSEILASMAASDARVKVLYLSRNFGHQAALAAGLEHVTGDAVVIMDADLQDPPEVVPEFVSQWQAGYQVVYGVRRDRKEAWWKRAGYFAFYRMLARFAYLDIPLDSGDFCLMDRRVVDEIKKLPEVGRYLRGLRSWAGWKQVGVPYERAARASGRPKYTLRKLIHLAADGFVSSSVRPLRVATKIGFTVAALSVMTALVYLVMWLSGLGDWPPGFATTVLLITFLFGVQFTLIGILGEYVGSIHSEVKRRPPYLVARRIGFDGDDVNTE